MNTRGKSTSAISDSQSLQSLLTRNRALLAQLGSLQKIVAQALLQENTQKAVLKNTVNQLRMTLQGKHDVQKKLDELPSDYGK